MFKALTTLCLLFLSQSVFALAQNYTQVYFRGTANDWGTQSMILVADHTWQIDVTFADVPNNRFKFDINGDWALNFGDNNNDFMADQGGGDIQISAGPGNYRIHFFDNNRQYQVDFLGAGNQSPIANAGDDQQVNMGATVNFDGAGSTDSDGEIISYAWSFGATTSAASREYPDAGEFVETLLVTDNEGGTGTDSVTISVIDPDAKQSNFAQLYIRGTFNDWGTTAMTLVDNHEWQATIAFAQSGDRFVKFDRNGDWASNYGDNQSDGIADQGGDNIVVANAGTYIAQFNDQTLAYSITVQGDGNLPPVANAGEDQLATVGDTIVLNGSASSDSDGSIEHYSWSHGVQAAFAEVALQTAGEFEYSLTVTDNDGASATDTIKITVEPDSGAFAHVYNNVYFRGTSNSWNATPMTLVADNTWEISQTFAATPDERFKFDIFANWVTNFGDNNHDFVAEEGGDDIGITTGAGNYKITFNDQNKAYSVSMQGNGNQETLSYKGDTATITSAESDDGILSYTLRTTHDLRDDLPASKQLQIIEHAEAMRTRTGSLMFDGLFAMALQELRDGSVDSITDGAFNSNNPTPCECFETGEKWTYVWTRDTAYAADLGLALVDPVRTRNSLLYKLSERKAVAGGGRLEIVQDTGSGGSWPVSTDRVVWAIGAWQVLKYLDGEERTSFRDTMYDALVNTIETDRETVFDENDGLYRGEQSFLDWREQTYPSWTADDTVHIGMSKALSTNAGHYAILNIAAQLAVEKNLAEAATQYSTWAAALKLAINAGFWLDNAGLYGTLKTTGLDAAPLHKYDLLGEALAILQDIPNATQAESIVSNYPQTSAGVPVVWPQLPDVAIYHNRGIWPFVTAYGLRAAKQVENSAFITHNQMSLIRGAALNLSNMENFEFLTLKNFVDAGEESGPVVNSRRQLWSVAGYVSSVVDVVFGHEVSQTGIRFKPHLTKHIRHEFFAESAMIKLENLAYKGKVIDVEVHLPPAGAAVDGAYSVAAMTLNGTSIGDAFVPSTSLGPTNTFVITLTDTASQPGEITLVADESNASLLFAPPEPEFEGILAHNGLLELTFSSTDSNTKFNIYRNSVLHAEGVTATTWVDEASADYENTTYCYAIEAEHVTSGLTSHHSPAQCYWSSMVNRVQTFSANDIEHVGGNLSGDHGRQHIANWGAPDDKIMINDFSPLRTGTYYVQSDYGNGSGSVATGITAAVKWLTITDKETGEIVAREIMFMPQLNTWSRWAESNFIKVNLDKTRVYNIELSDAFNMSYFDHFTIYDRTGGGNSTYNYANISAIKFLAIDTVP